MDVVAAGSGGSATWRMFCAYAADGVLHKVQLMQRIGFEAGPVCCLAGCLVWSPFSTRLDSRLSLCLCNICVCF
jgi:hypothetical protein